jgi:2-C-methyl-D-erythritol 4-phosphate cytidylyltransferase
MALGILLAAGTGERLGSEQAKAFIMLAGQPMLYWSIKALGVVEAIERIVVALPPDWLEIFSAGETQVTSVPGGPSRSASVRAALRAAGEGDPVVVHDAARPLATPDLFESALTELEDPDCDAAIVATPVTDTIKRADEARTVRETLERSSLWAVQTPQVFRRAVLENALDVDEATLAAATDDAWLVERAGGTVRVVPAPPENLKVTTPLDLRVAELLLRERC